MFALFLILSKADACVEGLVLSLLTVWCHAATGLTQNNTIREGHMKQYIAMRFTFSVLGVISCVLEAMFGQRAVEL
jgi:hypothetical protein